MAVGLIDTEDFRRLVMPTLASAGTRLDGFGRRGRTGLVAAGYALAIAAACAVLWIYVELTDSPERALSSGMYAFGDLMLFLAVFGLASVPAFGLALYYLRPVRAFWLWFVSGVVLWSVAGVGAAAAIVASRFAPPDSFVHAVATLGVLRILTAPPTGAAILASAVFAPSRGVRYLLFGLAVLETVLFATVVGWWTWSNLY